MQGAGEGGAHYKETTKSPTASRKLINAEVHKKHFFLGLEFFTELRIQCFPSPILLPSGNTYFITNSI